MRTVIDYVFCSGSNERQPLMDSLQNPMSQTQFEHYCSDSDLRYLALRGPSGLRVATAAAKLTRQQREMILSLAVSIQLKAPVK